MSKTRRKKKTASQNSFIGYTYLVIAIVLCLIALMHEMTGFLGRWLFSAGGYLFGQLWFVPYVIVIIMCLLKAYKVEMPAKLVVTMVLFFLATALILACLSFKDNKEPLKLISEYFHNTKEIFAGKAMGKSGLLGIVLYGLIASAADYWGVIIVICVLFIVGILIHTEEIKKHLKSLKKPEGTKKTTAEKNRQPSFFDLDEQKREEKRLKKEQRRREKEEQKLQKQEKKEQTAAPAPAKQPDKPAFVPAGDKSASAQKNYMLPSLSYLDTPVIDKSNVNRDNAREKWSSLSEILSSFDLDSSLEGYNIGPAITQFEIVPKSNFNINKYSTIERNIRMALAVSDVRIEAPIPGKRAVGIEIPNVKPTLVTLKEMLKDVPDEYQFNPLMIAVGKNISGKRIYGSINKMPHMLIAGATGSGKSVCINSIIMTILMRARPDEVKLLLIDPKKVEFSAFDNIPHLITPIITDTDKAAGALGKLIQVMEKRFDLFSQNRCQNIDQYNKSVPDEQKLCSIVCIIDELADLMMTHRNEVEPRITRLASLARAAGIYMILATQRPSTDIITGTIKANIVSRIAFAVNSGYDSKTILDGPGAEKLLGNGDMLYNPAGASAPTRVQGVYVSKDEIARVMEYFAKSKYEPVFDEFFSEEEDGELDDGGAMIPSGVKDKMYPEVEKWVKTQKTVSANQIQRRFNMGYPHAANLIDALEYNNVISGSNGSKPRDVLINEP